MNKFMFQKVMIWSYHSYKVSCKAAEHLNSEVKINVFNSEFEMQ